MTDETRPAVDLQTRRAALIHDLRTRLAAVCEGWPEELFTTMIEELADISLKYEGRATSGTYDRRSTDRLIAEMKAAIQRNAAARNEQKFGEAGAG